MNTRRNVLGWTVLLATVSFAGCYASPDEDPNTEPRPDEGEEATADAKTPDAKQADSATDWKDVYSKLFAANTPGHCANAGCHEKKKGGFLCGATAETCFNGLVAAGLLNLDDPKSSRLIDEEQSPLSWYGNTTDEIGTMPLDKAIKNEEAADLVTRWVMAGAKFAKGAVDAGKDTGTKSDAGVVEASTPDAASEASVADTGVADVNTPPDSSVAPDAAIAPATWTEIYTKFFGPNNPGHCGNSGCHLAIKSGFKCGPDKSSCFSGFVAAGIIDPVNPGTSIILDTAQSPLSWVNKTSGSMPKLASTTSPANFRTSVTAWLNAGALNN